MQRIETSRRVKIAKLTVGNLVTKFFEFAGYVGDAGRTGLRLGVIFFVALTIFSLLNDGTHSVQGSFKRQFESSKRPYQSLVVPSQIQGSNLVYRYEPTRTLNGSRNTREVIRESGYFVNALEYFVRTLQRFAR